MLQIKHTINCPGCSSILRVSTRVVSDGNEYLYYLCSKCRDIARQEPPAGEWRLQGTPSEQIPEVVKTLQTLAVSEWAARSAKRVPLAGKTPCEPVR